MLLANVNHVRIPTLTIGVFHGDNLLVVIKVVKQRCEDSPTGIKLIVTDKVGLITLQAVEDKRLVGLGDLEIRESAAVGKIELCDDSLHAQAGELGVHLDVNTLIGLDAHDKFVSGNILKNTRCDVLELNSDLGLLLIESLSSLHDERNAIPSFVLDVSNQGAESRTPRVLGHGVVFLVGRLATVERSTILTDDDILGLNGGDSAQNSDLFITDILGVE